MEKISELMALRVNRFMASADQMLANAIECHCEYGRGAYVAIYDSIVRLKKGGRGRQMIYMPAEDLVAINGSGELAYVVAAYDPSTHFVIVIAVKIGSEYTLHVSVVKPDPGRLRREGDTDIREFTNDVDPTLFTAVKCCNDGCNENGFKRCGHCRDAYYCSPSCQHADWKRHKTTCHEIAAARADLKSSRR